MVSSGIRDFWWKLKLVFNIYIVWSSMYHFNHLQKRNISKIVVGSEFNTYQVYYYRYVRGGISFFLTTCTSSVRGGVLVLEARMWITLSCLLWRNVKYWNIIYYLLQKSNNKKKVKMFRLIKQRFSSHQLKSC